MSRSRGAAALLALLALAAVAVGCGEGGGVAAGAAVDVYVAAELCPGAREALAGENGRAGELEVRALCLPPVAKGGRLDLATAGANARRATEDSTTVAFLETKKGKAAKFAGPIVEEAGIVFLEADSGATAMERVLRAVADAGSSPREKVREALE